MNILGGRSRGLINDALILQRAIKIIGYEANIQTKDLSSLNIKKRYPQFYHKVMRSLGAKEKVINFHLEEISSHWLKEARINAWLPNPEYVRHETSHYFDRADYVLCKTKMTLSVMSEIFNNCVYIGFSSLDRIDRGIQKDYKQCLHLMGQSHLKGTKPLLETWSRHIEWPQLTVVANKVSWNKIDWLKHFTAENIKIVYGPLPEQEIISLQNSCGIHLCPSEAEGFGHYIVEGLSTRAIVLTTNAPPMNQHLEESFGFLVNYNKVINQNLGKRYFVDHKDLENKIQNIVDMQDSDLEVLGKAARDKYEQINNDFIANLRAWITNI